MSQNKRLLFLQLVVCLSCFVVCRSETIAAQKTSSTATRTVRGLEALYDFGSTQGNKVLDRAGKSEPLHLVIEQPANVRRKAGSLTITKGAKIQSQRAAKRLTDAVKKTKQFTIEAWVQPSNVTQAGPARIVTLSPHTGERNFALGQEGDVYDVRFRTSKTDGNGIPSLASKAGQLKTKLTHVVYTRDANGRARLFLNGQLHHERQVAGDLSRWNDDYKLSIANEATGERPWLGTLRLIAIYSAALKADEVQLNYSVGVGGGNVELVKTKPSTTEPQPKKMASAPVASTGAGDRVSTGLQALYEFSARSGPVVNDTSGVAPALNLKITQMKSVKRSTGRLQVTGKTLIHSGQPSKKLSQAITRSGEVAIEAWIQPGNTTQAGPARIVSLSKDSNNRNFTLGQDGDNYETRFRTDQTSDNGLPASVTPSKTVKPTLTHVVYTRSRAGSARMYIDGRQVSRTDVPGSLSNWNKSFGLALANEHVLGRPWLGTFHLVAIYNRALSAKDVMRNFRAGAEASRSVSSTAMAEAVSSPQEVHFETVVAPILSKHCLECHDTSTHNGEFNLARKDAAFAGGESGKSIVAGKSADSLLWQQIESDDMPHNRPALNDDEKRIVKQWIDDGAAWSLQTIDPAIYTHDTRVARNWIRRLTVDEYIETVQATVGVDIGQEARKLLPRDVRADGFSNTAYNLNVDLKHVGAYAKLAEIIVGRMEPKQFARKWTSSPKLTDDNMRKLIRSMGKKVLRGPLEEHEVVTLRGISTTVASAGGNFNEAVGFVLEAMLQSPRFIYRVENQRGDGTVWPVGDYELASRISYTIWGSSPDEELVKAAESGILDRTEVEQQIDRMLQDEKAVRHSARFFGEWLNLNRLANMQPDQRRFPNWNGDLAKDMRSESLAFFHEVAWKQKAPLANLLNAKVTFVTPRLAKHYGLAAMQQSKEQKPDVPVRYDLAGSPRGGMLTHGSVLTVGGDEASMVTRGLLVLHELLRGVVKDPPPCVDTTPVSTKPGLTQRSIAMERLANANCSGCHSKFEPLAFGLERFDGLGSYHEKDEHGNALRQDGDILFPGDAEAIKFKTSSELMDLLAKSERVRESITWKLTQFAVGRPLVAADARTVDKIHKQSQQDGGTYQSLIKAIVLSDLVLTTRTETE